MGAGSTARCGRVPRGLPLQLGTGDAHCGHGTCGWNWAGGGEVGSHGEIIEIQLLGGC